MKIHELRIGNLVKCKTSNDSAIYSVIQIDGFGLKVRLSHPRHTEFTPLDRIKPIPLTEEILLKCGFRKTNLEGYDVHFKYTNPLLRSDITAIYNSDFSLKLDGVARGIKYLHRLQNLFFDLTGKELEVEL